MGTCLAAATYPCLPLPHPARLITMWSVDGATEEMITGHRLLGRVAGAKVVCVFAFCNWHWLLCLVGKLAWLLRLFNWFGWKGWSMIFARMHTQMCAQLVVVMRNANCSLVKRRTISGIHTSQLYTCYLAPGTIQKIVYAVVVQYKMTWRCLTKTWHQKQGNGLAQGVPPESPS